MIHRKLFIMAIAALLLAGTTQAAVITTLGSDTTTGADWRNAGVPKPSAFDPNGDNIYGSDGYFMGIYPGPPNGFNTTILKSTPSYLSALDTAYAIPTSNKYYSSSSYSTFNNPTAAGNVIGTLFYSNEAHFTFTVGQTTDFVLTVLVGTNGSVSPSSVTVDQTVGGSGTATFNFPGNNSVSEYVFFDISAATGDVFTVSKDGSTNAGITGVAFETVPEPASLILLGAGSMLVLSRRRVARHG